MNQSPFTGAGFSRAPFNEDENAAFREMFHFANNTRDTVSGIDGVFKASKSLSKAITVALLLGGALAWMVKSGVFL